MIRGISGKLAFQALEALWRRGEPVTEPAILSEVAKIRDRRYDLLHTHSQGAISVDHLRKILHTVSLIDSHFGGFEVIEDEILEWEADTLGITTIRFNTLTLSAKIEYPEHVIPNRTLQNKLAAIVMWFDAHDMKIQTVIDPTEGKE